MKGRQPNKPLHPVALLTPIPDHGLVTGQVGTIVEKLDNNVFEVEFSNKKGNTLITLAVEAKNLMLLHFEPAKQ